jgi:hypothetical protein
MALTRIKVLSPSANINVNSINVASTLTVSGNLVAGNVTTSGTAFSGGPKITSIVVTNSSFVANGWQAVSNTGGYITVNGSGFVSGAVVLIGTKTASATTFANSSLLRVQVPAQVEGTYPVYVTNPDGGVAINVPGLNYSPTPVWTSSSTLPSGIIGSAISIQLTATDTTTVSYSLASGSTLPTGLSLSSTGLLSGTVTGISGTTVYTFTVNAVDTYNQNTSQTFSITISIGDTYFPYTSLLLSSSTNSANNAGSSNANTVIDSSYNYNNITRAGNPGQGSFNPFGTTWSNYFNGSTDYLTTPANTAFAFGTGDFTIECWVYTNSSATQRIVSTGNLGGTPYEFVLVNTSSNVYVDFFDGTTDNTTGSNYVTQNQWVHLAVTRQGTALKLFINGVVSGSATNSVNLTAAGTLTIGRYGQAASGYFSGYISNLRIIKGTAVYTAAFTPPTAPLSVVANTVLLTSQSNRFVDNSTANTGSGFTVSPSGNTSIQRFNPFGVNGVPYATSANTYVGSTYFGGSDVINTLRNSPFLASGNFTIELWAYPINTTAGTIFTNYSSNISACWNITLNTSGYGVYFQTAGATLSIGKSGLLTPNTWYHIAMVGNSGTITGYLNGVSFGTFSQTGIGSSTLPIYIGAAYYSSALRDYFSGYISDARFVNGTAVYTSNFTPPTAPLTAVANTVLLTCQSTQTIYYDANTTPNSFAANGTPRLTKSVPYSQSFAGQFNGSTSYLSIPNNTAFGLGTNDYTIEYWIYCTSFSNTPTVVDLRPTGANTQWSDTFASNGAPQIYYSSSYVLTSSINVQPNTWTHVAYTRQSSNTKIWVNGTLAANVISSTNLNTSGVCLLGTNNGNINPVKGYISNARILNGTAVYTSNFTPSNTSLTAIANTVLLTCQNGSTSNTFIDNSTSALTITNNGTPGPNVVSMAAPGYSPMPSIIDSSSAALTYGGSYYFNGSTDSIVVPYNPNFNFGTGSFTVEFWFYNTTNFTTTAAPTTYTSAASGNSGYSFEIYWQSGTVYGLICSGASAYTASISAPSVNAWHHFALVRNGATLQIYIDGVGGTSVGSAAVAVNNNTSQVLSIGTNISLNNPCTGYMSDYRITNGVARYTGNFTPPTAPSSPSANIAYSGPANTVLLLSGTNVGSYDSTMINDIINSNTISVNSNVKQYGTNSYYFNGSGRLLIPANPALNLKSDFTIELWVYFSATLPAYSELFCTSLNGTAGANMTELEVLSNGSILYYLQGSALLTSSAGVVTTNTWYHIALVKNGTSQVLYLNGNSVASATSSTLPNSGYSWTIGDRLAGAGSGQYPLTGYIQDFRITNGVARYTANFTVPSSPHLTQ